jgi:ribosome biogenesis protein UTP30
MKEHDLFLVDDRIVPEMPRVLGKQWLQAKKSPIPVTLKRVDLKAELERAISSTYLRINKGTSVAVKIGSLAEHTAAQLRENLLAAIPHLAVRLPMGGWDNVQSLHIKTTSSAALPLWNCALDLPGEESKEGRFFVADVNEDEVEAKKQAKKEKEERIKAKKTRKLGGPVSASQLAIEAGGEEEESEEEEDANASAADLMAATVETQDGSDEDDDDDASPALEDIDESLVVPPSPSSSAVASPKPKAKASKDKKQRADAPSTKKTASSTSRKMKGLEAVKGMPRKVKQK